MTRILTGKSASLVVASRMNASVEAKVYRWCLAIGVTRGALDDVVKCRLHISPERRERGRWIGAT